ncbi:MAG: dihydrolipoamide acetyltransferase family protein [Candidatus Nanoarchaeia archaeon]|nr:dihydrolipoamide acetyltransferase family protein [Candidatus Nanoarchaeia archaeon]
MVTAFRFPDVGEGITDGVIKKWLVKKGVKVKKDENIAQVETDKAVVEIPSPVAGHILKINVQQNKKVKVGEVMVYIGKKGEKITDLEKEKPEKTKEPKKESKNTPKDNKKEPGVLAILRVRKLAENNSVDLSSIKGTGHNGSITEWDVLNSIKGKSKENSDSQGEKESKPKVLTKYDFYGHLERIKYEGTRKVIGENMVKSRFSSPHAVLMDDADVTKLWELREKEKIKAKKKRIKLTPLTYILKAVVEALKKNPIVNSAFDEENQTINVKKYYNIGFAVETDAGLLVPVVKGAEKKNIYAIAKEIEILADKARKRKIDLEEMKGNSFTITNWGYLGGTYGVPIINPGDGAILGTGRVKEIPRYIDGELKPRQIMALSISFDHRVMDGAVVVKFLNDLKDYLENPTKIK